MPRRIDLGRAVLLVGSALLFISLFLSWYESGSADATAWEVFETLDLVLAGLALAGMVAAVRPDLLPPWAGVAVPGAALLIVFVQLVNQPPAAPDADIASGAWVALAGTVLMAAGAAMSLASISVTVQVAERDVRRRVPAVDRRGRAEEDEALAAEDLDADAGEPADASDEPRRGGSLFAEGAPGPATGISSAGAGDLERTQPMAALPDEEQERPERP